MKRESRVFNESVNNFCDKNKANSICIKNTQLNEIPRLSIVIPTYKRVRTLKFAIDSAISQDYEDCYEIIVLDNNPERNDETEQLVMTHYKNVNLLAYYKNGQNLGMIGNWNRMYEVAKAEWVAMLHDDDILFPYAMRMGMNIIKRNGFIDALFLTHTLDSSYTPISNPKGYYVRLTPFDFRIDNMGDVVGTLLKRDVVIKLGGFNNDYYPSSDYHFWALLSLKANVYRLFGSPMGYYRIDINGASKIETLGGFVKKNREIMLGLLQDRWLERVRKVVYDKYVQIYLLMLINNWVSLFSKNVDENKIEEIRTMNKLNYSLINKIIYRIYNVFSKLSLRYRKRVPLS